MDIFFCLIEHAFLFGPLEDLSKLLGDGGLGQWPHTLIVLGWILVVKAGPIHKMAPLKKSKLFKGKSYRLMCMHVEKREIV